MATMNTVIEKMDRLKPNVFTDLDKYAWINTLEGLVAREVLDEDTPTYQFPEDGDTELLIPSPFEDLYELWVGSMIDFYNREYDEYNNTALMFQTRYEQYKEWYIRRNTQGKALNFRNVMG